MPIVKHFSVSIDITYATVVCQTIASKINYMYNGIILICMARRVDLKLRRKKWGYCYISIRSGTTNPPQGRCECLGAWWTL